MDISVTMDMYGCMGMGLEGAGRRPTTFLHVEAQLGFQSGAYLVWRDALTILDADVGTCA